MKNLLSTALLLVVGGSHAYLPIPYIDPSAAPSPPSRKDIDTLSSTEYNLFVLSMQKWQNVSATVVSGFFQVAGIHGAPHKYWDNAGNYQTTSQGDKQSGYCFHGDQNFYLWHRPYLALFEQQMRATATQIANSWYQPQRAQYQAAASTLRLPYWDWAKSSTPGTVPASISSPQIQVPNPSTGTTMTINNPLYSHTLVSNGNLGAYSDGYKITVGPNRTTNRGNNYLKNLQSQGPGLQRNTALMFNTPNTCWNVFATESSNERQTCSNANSPSLEGTHNTVHNTIGGTMVDLDISAFDPIFWLHHANVDRLGAIWQAINPNTQVVSTFSNSDTFVAGNGNRDATFPFLPFRWQNTNTDWWQPRWVYDTRTTGYVYPELADQPSPSTALSRVNALYGTGRTQQAVSTSSSKRFKRFARFSRQTSTPITNLLLPPTQEQLAPFASLLINSNGSFQDYFVQTTISKSVAPGTSFTLYLFFGDVTTTDYINAPNRVGSFSVAQAGGTSMAGVVSGVVPITDALLNVLIAGIIKDLKPATVRKYVRARLVWRLVTADGEEISVQKGRQNGLQIKVQQTIVTPAPSDDVLPEVAPSQEIADTTNNTIAAPIPSGVAPSATLPIDTTSGTSTATSLATAV